MLRRSFLLTAPAALDITAARAASSPLRVRLVAGGHGHDPEFYQAFTGDERFRVNVEPHPNAYKGSLLKNVDVLVQYDLIREASEADKTALRAFAEAGKGIVILHHAICSFTTWPWWWQEVAGGLYLNETFEGKGPSTFHHDEQIRVKVVKPHAATQGVSDFEIFDETYNRMWMSPRNEVLLRTDHPKSDGPVMWVSPYKASGVVVLQLGHGREANTNPNWQRLVRNAIVFAGGKTT
jgi:type 1 glutamine amidotransferase